MKKSSLNKSCAFRRRSISMARQSSPGPQVRPSMIFHRFNRAQQNGGRVALAFGHDVHAMMHAVDDINVGVAGRAEHDLGAFSQAFRRMRGEVVFAEIGFDFDDFADALDAAGMVNEPFSEQFLRDEDGVAVVKSCAGVCCTAEDWRNSRFDRRQNVRKIAGRLGGQRSSVG